MHSMGGSWKQLQPSLMLSSGIIGITVIVMGTLRRPRMRIINIRVVSKISLGWEIHFEVFVFSLSVVRRILFVTDLLAGLLAAKVAQKWHR